MNRRMIVHTVGHIALAEAGLMLLPLVVALIYRERSGWAFLATILICLAVGAAMTYLVKPKSTVIYAREGFAIVSLGWLLTTALGALPYTLSGEIPSYIDAFFEAASGFTTTGSSIVPDITALSHAVLIWRSFTHWVGGMGVLVFIMALMPTITDRSIHIVRAEMPGPVVGKLVPRVKDTAKILYIIYIIMTAVTILLLIAGGMPVFDSFFHAFGTAGTGGFSMLPDCQSSYNTFCQWVLTIGMFLFGINFNLYYLLLIRRGREVVRSDELWAYAGIVGVSTVAIMINIWPSTNGFWDALKHAAFQVSSIITTTGYATTDFNLWPGLSKTILLLLMFVGGCAGSTAGGLKVSRAVMLVKQIGREFKRLLHPRSVSAVRFEGKTADEQTLYSVSIYFSIYMLIVFALLLLISFEPFDFETKFSSVVTCFNNVGPGLGAVGPMGNFSIYSDFTTLVLSFAMLLGRLEIFPLILIMAPSTWTKR